MNIKIITDEQLNYIDTLYLYYKKVDISVYTNLSGYIVDNSNHWIGIANGRVWYHMGNYRIGVMEYEKAEKTNQFQFLIQFEWEYISKIKDLRDIDAPLPNTNILEYIIQRVDICKIIDLNHKYGDVASKQEYVYKTNFHTDNEYMGTRYLGNRSNGCVFRIYNKTKELNDTKNYKKREWLSNFFNNIDDLYTFELELRRKYLQPLKINTVSDYSRLIELYNNIVGGIMFFRLNDYNFKQFKNRNYDRIDLMYSIDKYKDFNRPNFALNKDNFRKNLVRKLLKETKEYSKLYDVLITDDEIENIIRLYRLEYYKEQNKKIYKKTTNNLLGTF